MVPVIIYECLCPFSHHCFKMSGNHLSCCMGTEGLLSWMLNELNWTAKPFSILSFILSNQTHGKAEGHLMSGFIHCTVQALNARKGEIQTPHCKDAKKWWKCDTLLILCTIMCQGFCDSHTFSIVYDNIVLLNACLNNFDYMFELMYYSRLFKGIY